MTNEELLKGMIDALTEAVAQLQGQMMVCKEMLAEVALSLPASDIPVVLSRLEAAAERQLASMDDLPGAKSLRDGVALASAAVLTHIRAYRP